LTGSFVSFYLIFGSSSFSRLISLPVQDRYFQIAVPFLAVSVSELVTYLGGLARRRTAEYIVSVGAALMMTFASLPSVVINAGESTFSSLGRNSATAIRALKGVEPRRPIYVSPELQFVVEGFLKPDEYRDLKVIAGSGPMPAGFYLLHPVKDVQTRYKWVG